MPPPVSVCATVLRLTNTETRWPSLLERPGGPGFESHCGDFDFELLAIPFTPLCQCLSEETLKSVGPFYLVPMPGEVNDPTSPHCSV